jgi:hypothetical protein
MAESFSMTDGHSSLPSDWLHGVQTVETATGNSLMQRIEMKTQEIHKLLPKWVESGGNPLQIQARFETFHKLIQEGKTNEAEAELDQILTIVREASERPGGSQQTGSAPGKENGEPRYLTFQLFAYAPNPDGQTQPFDKTSVKNTVLEIVSQLGGARGDGGTRFVGFAVGPLSLDHSDDELRKMIHGSFEVAEELNVAVAFHLDDSMFWINRKDLWQNKANVEWTDWNAKVSPARIIGWVPTRLAPQMCYTSPAIRNEVSRIAREVIGDAVKNGLSTLKEKNKEHLFAGVIAGWETRMDDDSGKNIGYCALSHLSFSAANSPKNIDRELETIVQDWIAFWVKELHRGGVPKERLYTHVPITDVNVHAPPWAAFNPYSRPGFSVYSSSKTFSAIYAELEKHGNPHWANSEGTNVDLIYFARGQKKASDISWDEYLGRMFNHGASLVNIFGWQDTDSAFGKATRSKEALTAYKKFLKGQ